MSGESDTSLTPASFQNDFLAAINSITGAVGAGAQSLASAYSTFLGAKYTLKLQNMQQQGINPVPTNDFTKQRDNVLIYVGVGLAVIGTLALIYKAVK